MYFFAVPLANGITASAIASLMKDNFDVTEVQEKVTGSRRTAIISGNFKDEVKETSVYDELLENDFVKGFIGIMLSDSDNRLIFVGDPRDEDIRLAAEIIEINDIVDLDELVLSMESSDSEANVEDGDEVADFNW